jgi:hypothetical protein
MPPSVGGGVLGLLPERPRRRAPGGGAEVAPASRASSGREPHPASSAVQSSAGALRQAPSASLALLVTLTLRAQASGQSRSGRIAVQCGLPRGVKPR